MSKDDEVGLACSEMFKWNFDGENIHFDDPPWNLNSKVETFRILDNDVYRKEDFPRVSPASIMNFSTKYFVEQMSGGVAHILSSLVFQENLDGKSSTIIHFVGYFSYKICVKSNKFLGFLDKFIQICRDCTSTKCTTTQFSVNNGFPEAQTTYILQTKHTLANNVCFFYNSF